MTSVGASGTAAALAKFAMRLGSFLAVISSDWKVPHTVLSEMRRAPIQAFQPCSKDTAQNEAKCYANAKVMGYRSMGPVAKPIPPTARAGGSLRISWSQVGRWVRLSRVGRRKLCTNSISTVLS